MPGEIGSLVKEYFESLQGPDGTLDLFQLLGTSGQDSGDEYYRERIERLARTAEQTTKALIDLTPGLKAVNKFEATILHDLSEYAFPYWFSTEYLNFPRNAECSREYPVLCLAPDELALIVAWIQIVAFAVAMFSVILVAGTIGIFSRRPRLRKGIFASLIIIFLCFIIDLLGIGSLIIPVAGNLVDIAWAPVAGFAVGFLLSSPKAGFLIMMKELLPFGDIIPLATLMGLAHVLE